MVDTNICIYLMRHQPPEAFEARAARAYGPIRASSCERNTDALDKLIAAYAAALGVTLVTNNEADFHTYPELTLENWMAGH